MLKYRNCLQNNSKHPYCGRITISGQRLYYFVLYLEINQHSNGSSNSSSNSCCSIYCTWCCSTPGITRNIKYLNSKVLSDTSLRLTWEFSNYLENKWNYMWAELFHSLKWIKQGFPLDFDSLITDMWELTSPSRYEEHMSITLSMTWQSIITINSILYTPVCYIYTRTHTHTHI